MTTCKANGRRFEPPPPAANRPGPSKGGATELWSDQNTPTEEEVDLTRATPTPDAGDIDLSDQKGERGEKTNGVKQSARSSCLPVMSHKTRADLREMEAKFWDDEKLRNMYLCLKLHLSEERRCLARMNDGINEHQDNILDLSEKMSDLSIKKDDAQNIKDAEEIVANCRRVCRLPWKNLKDVHFALEYERANLNTYLKMVVPESNKDFANKICRALFDVSLAQVLKFNPPRSNKEAYEEVILMGRAVVRMPTLFPNAAYDWINERLRLKNKRLHQRRLGYFFENQVRAMRKNQVSLALPVALGPSEYCSKAATLLICQDHVDKSEEFHEVGPDLSNEKLCKNFLERNGERVWRSIRALRRIPPDEELTNAELIERCSSKDLLHYKKMSERYINRLKDGKADEFVDVDVSQDGGED